MRRPWPTGGCCAKEKKIEEACKNFTEGAGSMFPRKPHNKGGQKRPENVAQLRAHIVKLCRALSEDLCRKVVTNAKVRLQEVVRQNGGHIERVLH